MPAMAGLREAMKHILRDLATPFLLFWGIVVWCVWGGGAEHPVEWMEDDL